MRCNTIPCNATCLRGEKNSVRTAAAASMEPRAAAKQKQRRNAADGKRTSMRSNMARAVRLLREASPAAFNRAHKRLRAVVNARVRGEHRFGSECFATAWRRASERAITRVRTHVNDVVTATPEHRAAAFELARVLRRLGRQLRALLA